MSAVSAVDSDNLTSVDDVDSTLNMSSCDNFNVELDNLSSKSSNEDTSVLKSSCDSNELKSASDESVKFSSKNVVSTYGKKATFSVKVLDGNGNLLKNKHVIFKVAGKTYNVSSNSNGIASIKIKLNAGKYDIKYSCDNFSGKSTITFKNYYKIKVYKWKSGANIKRNKKIRENIPKSSLVKKIVKLAKKGTPMIKFAVMKLIKYLQSHPIKGTVYIIPFINPKATASNVRDYKGINLNAKANVKGTISYKTVKLIKKFKCDAYGDFHCTRPGGKPGKDIAMGTYKPTAKSATMAKFIAKKSNVKYLIYKKAGAEYPGALEDMVSLKHIPAVTCEVITPHGKIAKGSVGKSLSMMKSLLKFNEVI